MGKERQRGLGGLGPGCLWPLVFAVLLSRGKVQAEKLLLRQEPLPVLDCRGKKRESTKNRERKQENRNQTQHVSQKGAAVWAGLPPTWPY